jgi:hypothetical protein
MSEEMTIPLDLDCHSAVFSKDGLYRYELRRRWGCGDLVLWIMLNPSTADEMKDDPTIRRCIRFSQRWGFGGIVVCNLFALRATDPKRLREVEDPTGPENFRTIRAAAEECSKVVCAWGGYVEKMGGETFLSVRPVRVFGLLRDVGCAPLCLGTTKMGHPRHPLYVPYSQNLVALERVS